MSKQAYVKEIPHLASPPGIPSTGWTKFYYHQPLNCFVFYDEVRNKWLADAPFEIHVGRNGNLAPGSSFRFTDSLPTSTNPILLERNCTLVGIVASTSASERFVIRVDDVSGGSGTQTAINYEAPGPAATTNFIDLTLNADYNANDRLDIYVLSSNTGNISNPLVKLIFRYRV